MPVCTCMIVLFAYFYAGKLNFSKPITYNMIQRVQTIWLLLACACAILTMYFPFYTGQLKTLTDAQINGAAPVPLTAMQSIPIIMLTGLSGLGSLITIFLFKDRKLQMRITVANIIISVIIIAMYFLNMKDNYSVMGLPVITCIFTFAIPIFLILAFSGIYKDHRLVKSVDRLR